VFLFAEVDDATGCGHIIVIAAAIAAASSSVGAGEIAPMLTFIASPPLNQLLCRATFGCSRPTTSKESQGRRTTD
jgi:hypothetical protein